MMFPERFSDWFFAQPDITQCAVLFGPPLAIAAIIALALGGGSRLAWWSWLEGPALGAAYESDRRQKEDEAASEWTQGAKASVDELVARRNRGLP